MKKVIVEKMFDVPYAQKYYDDYIFQFGDQVCFNLILHGMTTGTVINYEGNGFYCVNLYGITLPVYLAKHQLKLIIITID